MTPEEIKKIAEEYVNDIVNRMGIPKDYISAETRKGLRYDCEPILRWLTERYYLVEKGKVEDVYNDFENDGFYVAEYDNKILNDYDVEVYFVSLFGPDIRKEEEDA